MYVAPRGKYVWTDKWNIHREECGKLFEIGAFSGPLINILGIGKR